MNRLIGAMVIAAAVCPMAVAQPPPAPAPDAANPVFLQPQDLKWQVYPGGSEAGQSCTLTQRREQPSS